MEKNNDGVAVCIRTQVDPREIQDHINPLNWKDHTKRQLEYVTTSISDNGWVGTPIYCANTERIINGHGRLKISLAKKYREIPIDVGWWTEEQGNELLLSLDTTVNMSAVNGTALLSLTEATIKRAKEGKKADTPKIGLMTDVHSFAQGIIDRNKDHIGIRQSKKSIKKIIGESKKTKRDERETGTDYDESMYHTELREDLLFPSRGNGYGIPDLLPSKLWTNTKLLPESTFARDGKPLLSTMYYCQNSRPFDSKTHAKAFGGFLGFHFEDVRFARFYREPAKSAEMLIDEQWHAVFEPDYSTYWDWPFAKRLWSIYKSRWCCRYWQQLGIKIIPLVRRTNDLDRDHWMYSSLPEKMPVAGMQIRMGGKKHQNDAAYWSGIGAALQYCVDNNGLKFVLFYGGKELEKYVVGKLPEGLKYRMIIPFINARRSRK